jgi:hypothetical protein
MLPARGFYDAKPVGELWEFGYSLPSCSGLGVK